MDPETPSRAATAAATCPVCQGSFVSAANKRYCSKPCRDTAWRRRHQAPLTAIVVPPALSRRPATVYECEACGIRALGCQRCEECGSFMRRVGLGGSCPHCDEPVAVSDLLDATAPRACR